MYDRVAANPGRYKITFEDPNLGEKYGVLSLADSPSQQGTPLNSMTLASDAVLEKAGLLTNGTPSDVLNAILDRIADTSWQEVDVIGSEFVLHSSTQKIRYRKIGKMIIIEGVVKPANAIPASNMASTHLIFTLPTGYRPSRAINKVQQGSYGHIWLLTVSTNGAVSFSRYRTPAQGSNEYSQAGTGVWLPFYEVFVID